MINTQRWYFPLCIFLASCLGVFVLPFFLPPPYLAGISAANVAGFNNKVASLAAATLSVFVGFAALFSPPERRTQNHDGDFRTIPRPLIVVLSVFCGCMVTILSYIIAISNQPYGDGRYFLHQIGMYVEYGRRLYDQIELPYGPLLFYGPAMVHRLLSPLHVSLTAAYFITLVLEHVAGLLLVAYVLNSLPILRRWKIVFLLLCLVHTYPFGFGLNYTFLRFVLPIALLIMAARQNHPYTVAIYFFVGQMLSLSLSPELGLAYGASSFGFAAYRLFTARRAWIAAVVAPFAATVAFLTIAGAGYLRMLKLFARGIANFVIEPLPFIFVFLFALVWLVPVTIAGKFRTRRIEAPLLAALYVFSMALLPVAFGRADPGHVFFNGFGIYLLSLVAISDARPVQQWAWMTCVVLIVSWSAFQADRYYWPALLDRVHRSASYQPLDLDRLKSIVGNNPVALPETVPWPVELAIRQAGLFAPTFYNFDWSVLDSTAEDRQIAELNDVHWALLRLGPVGTYTETQEKIAPYLGHRLPYRSPYPDKRMPYLIGKRLQANMAEQWEPFAQLGQYELYKRRD